MRILWISHFLLYPETGFGALQRSRALIKQLGERHRVFLVSYYRRVDLESAEALDIAREDLLGFCEHVELLPSPFDRSPLARPVAAAGALTGGMPYSAAMYRSSALSDAVGDAVRKFGVDLVHADTLGLIDDRVTGVPAVTVLNHHNVESQMMFRRAERETSRVKRAMLRAEARGLRAYEKAVAPKFDLNLVVSDLDRERMESICPELRIEVIENAVDCDYYRPGTAVRNAEELVFVGPLDWYPNADAMVFFCEDVWPLLRTRFPRLRLTIIGKNPPARLARLVDRESRVELKGFVPDVREFVSAATVFVCPIRDGGGSRLKILDALAQGIPVVSTRVGSEGIDAHDREHLLLADSAADLASRTGELLLSGELRAKLAENGRRLVEQRYSFDVVGEKLAALYSAACARRAERARS